MNLDRKTRPASAGPFFDALAHGVGVLTGAVLAALVTLVCLEALLRGAFHHSPGFAEELTGYGVVVLTFFGSALALQGASMFQVHFLLDRWREGARRWLVRGFVLIALVICVILAWKTKDLALSSLSRGKFASTVLRTTMGIPQVFPRLGFCVLGVFLVEQFLLTFQKRGSDH